MAYTPWTDAPWSPRRWQAEALPVLQRAIVSEGRHLLHACTGAGKSILVAEVVAWARAYGGRVVCSVPSRALVRQLSETLAARLGEPVGQFFTDAKEADAGVVVCCNASLPALAEVCGPVDLWICDEAHQSEADTIRAGATALAPRRAVGVTATPYRSDDLERLSLWESVVYSYTVADALADGVLVPWDVRTWDGVGDRRDVNGICAGMIAALTDGPGIVSARSIEDAEDYAERLTADGIPAAAIHSRQPRAERDRLLAQLQAGELRALVHVALLAEGVDLPWLRWLCLRRRVSARVRFVQEVGRVLRVAPGKDRAVILDPYDLFSAHGIAHPAALGEPPTRPEPPPVEEDPFPLLDLPPVESGPLPPAVAVDAVGAWSRALLRLMEGSGLYKPDPNWTRPDARWRRQRATDGQVRALERMRWATRYMPASHREAVKAICDAPHRLRAGVASDLMTVLRCIADASATDRKARRHWRWPTVLDVPTLPARVTAALGAG